MIRSEDSRSFSKEEYYANPHQFTPTFHESIAPVNIYLLLLKNNNNSGNFIFYQEMKRIPFSRLKKKKYTSVLVNGMYWDQRFPRLLTTEQMKEVDSKAPGKLLCVADITCLKKKHSFLFSPLLSSPPSCSLISNSCFISFWSSACCFF